MSAMQTISPWARTVRTHTPVGTVEVSEMLDMDAAVERLYEAMQERPDGSLRDWLDCALNGWGDTF